MAQVAWTKGYLHGVGAPNVARAFARKRSLENIRQRRAALATNKARRALDRDRNQILKSIGARG